jgi:mono/diheme cytochrome c family protein
MIHKHLSFKSLLTSLLFFFTVSAIGQPSIDQGKNLFKQYCGACHAKNMVSAATGPGLAGAQERWDDDAALYAWIRNSQAMIADGYPRAVEMWNQYKPTVMTAYPDLTDDEIGSLLLYINGVADGSYPPKPAGVAAGADVEVDTGTPAWLYWLLFFILAGLALFLTRVINNLGKLTARTDGEEYEDKTIMQTLTSKGVVGFAIFALVVYAGYTTVNNATNLGRQEGYAPEQPINFSHETHSGLHQIDCNYCHDGARRSKHSVIPAANTCMNCHRAITVGSQYGTAELTKIFASMGYDPNTNTYIEDYENMAQEDIEPIYTKWIGDQYVAADDDLIALDSDGEREVKKQWDNIVKSLTNDQKKKIQGPIEWERVHNLPDHVYFNHAQHVSVGKVECQTCHGKVEEMPVLQQMSPLSMGWCVNCHRQTEVKFASNPYYASYNRFHEQLGNGEIDKVTVEDIGGLECQKCHY